MTYQPTKKQEEQIRKAWGQKNPEAFLNKKTQWKGATTDRHFYAAHFRDGFISAMLKAGLWSEEGEK